VQLRYLRLNESALTICPLPNMPCLPAVILICLMSGRCLRRDLCCVLHSKHTPCKQLCCVILWPCGCTHHGSASRLYIGLACVFMATRSQHGLTEGKSCLTNLVAFYNREEQLTSSTWTCAKHLTLSCTTSLSLKWRDMDLMDAPLGG